MGQSVDVWTIALSASGAIDLVVNEWDSSGIAGLDTTEWLVYPNVCD
jgi:hypothetical protein